MMFRRSRLQDRLHDYVAGDLDASARAEVEEILAKSPAARELLDEANRAHEALTTLRERPEPPVAADDVLPRIRGAIAVESFHPRPRLSLEGQGTRFYRRLAYAAMLLCTLTVALLVMRGGEAPPARPDVRVPSAIERGLEPMSAEEYLRLLERAGGDPDKLTITLEDDVVPISLDSEPR